MPIHKTLEGLERIHVDNIEDLGGGGGAVTIEQVKATEIVFQNEEVTAGDTIFSEILNVITVKTVLVIGNQTKVAGVEHVEGITLEVWGANEDNDDAFWGPCALGEFSLGYLYFGSFECNFKYLKIRVSASSSAVNTEVNVKLLSVI